MAEKYDLIVLGSGPGGYVAAIRGAQLGLKVAIVERELLGGICLNWGCIPTKALLRSSEVFHLMERAKDFGLSADKIGYDLDAVVKRSRGVAKQLSSGVSHLIKKNKVEAITNLERSLRANRPRALIQMATGSGKTLSAFLWSLDQVLTGTPPEDPHPKIRNRNCSVIAWPHRRQLLQKVC